MRTIIKSSTAKQWLLVQREVLHEAVKSLVFPGIEVMQSKLINTCCEIRSCCKSVIKTFFANHEMRLPRRVPWASLSELDQVCAWIYADEHDLHTKTLAINRVRH